ncbi:MAG: NAD(P)-dependent glycerol-1-phosphate dehydrogenase [Nanoarchaeota archaeon]|nr:NAD(P)-dependent glycerol-1-phosphate dehydrogenase [Nanoarchaeota archaeon]
MDAHRIELPREIIIGNGILKDIEAVCKKLQLEGSCLLVSGPSTMKVAGEAILKELGGAGYVVNAVIADSIDKAEVDKIVEKAKAFDFIIGAGGGKVIDIAKYASFKSGIPFISVPTAPSHDGIASSRATLNGHNGLRASYDAQVPLAIVADIDIISKAPYRLIASGCADVISNMISVEDWQLGHKKTGEYYSDYAASIAVLAANVVSDSADMIRNLDQRGIRNLMEAIVSSGAAMCIAGSSRPASGSEHLFSHALDTLMPEKKSLHGEQCGVGSIMMAYLHKLPWQRIVENLKRLGCPTTAQEMGVPDDIIIKALVMAKDIKKERYTILNEADLNEEKARNLARVTGVIK